MKETIVENEIDKLVKQSLDNQKNIVLYNDDVNSFDHVVDCLIKYCKHSPNQAIQCSMIVHNNGKCGVKRGSFDDLLPIYTVLLDNELKVELQ